MKEKSIRDLVRLPESRSDTFDEGLAWLDAWMGRIEVLLSDEKRPTAFSPQLFRPCLSAERVLIRLSVSHPATARLIQDAQEAVEHAFVQTQRGGPMEPFGDSLFTLKFRVEEAAKALRYAKEAEDTKANTSRITKEQLAKRAATWVKDHKGKYPGDQQLARELKCSSGSLTNAIKKTAPTNSDGIYLRARRAEYMETHARPRNERLHVQTHDARIARDYDREKMDERLEPDATLLKLADTERKREIAKLEAQQAEELRQDARKPTRRRS